MGSVNQVCLICKLAQQQGQHLTLISPDQAVAPVRVTPRAEQVQHLLALHAGFVDRLHRLEWERDAQRRGPLAVFVIFSLPDEFGHKVICPSSFWVEAGRR